MPLFEQKSFISTLKLYLKSLYLLYKNKLQ
jgi:hypothetical protein